MTVRRALCWRRVPNADRRVGGLFDGEFRLEQALGRGMMGTVYRATWLGQSDQPQVAVKILAATLDVTGELNFSLELPSARKFTVGFRCLAN